MDLRGRNKIDPSFSLSSMTDIIFLLLIFFIITSAMVSPQNAISLILPKADGKVIKGGEPTAISIAKSGKYYLNENEINPIQIDTLLIKHFEKVPENERNLTIRAEQGVPIEKVVEVLSIANKNKYKTVLATEPKE